MPSIAVLIPAHNASVFIGEALECLASQVCPPDQIVLVDDGSIDGTADVAEAAAQKLDLAVEIIRQTNRGPAAARNVALRQVRTALVALLDADDTLLPDHLRALGAAFDQRPKLVGCFGDQEIFDGARIVEKSFLARKPILQLAYDEQPDGLRVLRVPLFTSLLRGNYIPTSGSVLSVAALRRTGGYNENLVTSEDRELLLRLSLLGPFAYYPFIVARKREHGESLTAHRTVALARNGVAALLYLQAAKLDLTADEQDDLNAALRASVNDLLYRASCDGLSAYLAARRWIGMSLLTVAPPNPRDVARALLRTSGAVGPALWRRRAK